LLVAYFGDPKVRSSTRILQQIKSLQKLIGNSINSCYLLIPSIQMEKPLSDLKGIKQFLGKQKIINVLIKIFNNLLNFFNFICFIVYFLKNKMKFMKFIK
jgi:hypothetical protein